MEVTKKDWTRGDRQAEQRGYVKLRKDWQTEGNKSQVRRGPIGELSGWWCQAALGKHFMASVPEALGKGESGAFSAQKLFGAETRLKCQVAKKVGVSKAW